MTKFMFLFTIVFILISATSVFANVNIRAIGSYDVSKVQGQSSAGVEYKATDVGYGYEVVLSYHSDIAQDYYLGLGAFYYKNSSKTSKINTGDSLQNFHFSPHGYGAELSAHFSLLMFRAGAGVYKAKARKVVSSVGTSYELSNGFGYHGGVGAVVPMGSFLRFLVTATARQIKYGKVKIEGSSATPSKLTPVWKQTIVEVGAGFIITF